jgi:ATP-dependent DNA ligase
MPLCCGPTACRYSTSCVDERLAILYAVDLIDHDGEDMRNRPFLDRKAALARVSRNAEAGILFNEHIAEDGPIVFAHACRLGAEGMIRRYPCSPPAWWRLDHRSSNNLSIATTEFGS